ncbi:31208_t:CDS:2, partial [Racocetra persica]
VKYTEKGEIVLTISMLSKEDFEENKMSSTHGRMNKKGILLIELHDTGIGMNPEYIQHAWESFSRGDTSITRKQDGTGLGLSICKSLVEINGGEIKAESQLEVGSTFWFTWNIELLFPITPTNSSSIIPTNSKLPASSLFEAQFDKQINYTLPNFIRKKRILIIHPIKNMRTAMLTYFKIVEKVDAFSTFNEGIKAAQTYKELHNQFDYDIAFIGLYEDNEEEVMKAALELIELDMDSNRLVIIFIVFPNNEGNVLARNLIRKLGGTTSVIYTPITLKKLINQVIHLEKNITTDKNNTDQHTDESNDTGILKRVVDYELYKVEGANQDIYENITGKDLKRKCILCVDGDSISLKSTLQQISNLGYSTISAANGQEAVRLIDSDVKLLRHSYSNSSNSEINQVESCRISLILTEYSLPIMSGFDVSRAIRAMRPPISNIPIIVLTSLSVKEIQNGYIESGINDYLAKPLKTDELEKVLTKWI